MGTAGEANCNSEEVVFRHFPRHQGTAVPAAAPVPAERQPTLRTRRAGSLQSLQVVLTRTKRGLGAILTWLLEVPTAQAEFLWFAKVSVGTSDSVPCEASHTDYTKMLTEKQTFCSAGGHRRRKGIKEIEAFWQLHKHFAC